MTHRTGCDYCSTIDAFARRLQVLRCSPVLTLTLCIIGNSIQKQDRYSYRIKALFVSWDLINSLFFTVFGQYIMAHSLLLICLWSKDVGLLFSSSVELKINSLILPQVNALVPSVNPHLYLNFKVLCIYPDRVKETYFSSLDFIQLNRLKDNQVLSQLQSRLQKLMLSDF